MSTSTLSTSANTILSPFELERYQRQIDIEGFGEAAQRKLKAATAMISRVGGVGGNVAINLVYAGIGRLVVAHAGTITPDYLNRWYWARESDLGRPVLEAFVERVRAMNSAVEIVAVPQYVDDANVGELAASADVIVDGAPLFEERYAMNREAVRTGKPLVMAAVNSTDSYVTTIVPGRTPCLACIYPSRPESWTNIKVFPVIGAGSSVVASVAAMEAIKVVTGFGEPLAGTLWHFDLETTRVRRLKVARRADCAVCGRDVT